MAERGRRLLAGSHGPERMPVRRDRQDADWFKPPHVRDEAGARERIAAQIAAGADVVVAPTWLTHRRALLPLGETRRVAEWTAAAVRVARDGVELGLERRDETLAEVTAGTDQEEPSNEPVSAANRGDRPTPLVAATLPTLDDGAEQEHGRLLPRDAATERDYRDQAGILADAVPDLILVEGQHEAAEAFTAMIQAVDTGVPVWVALGGASLTSIRLEDWLERARSVGVECLLLPPPLQARTAAIESELAWGGVSLEAGVVGDWLDAGASVVGQLDHASTESLGPLRRAIDQREEAESIVAQAASRRWETIVADAAAIAPGGAAVWIGDPPSGALPSGFEWLHVDALEAQRLPSRHFRLVVSAEPEQGAARWLERGGILARPGRPGAGDPPGLRLIQIDEDADPPLAIYRLED